jgi:tetratricopeptide (TPR) repeat protein
MTRRLIAAVLVSLLAACASTPRPEPGPPPTPFPTLPPHPETPAVASLIDNARLDSQAGRYGNAAASLERALRIEPRNPRLWQELSRVRYSQREFAQAESCAQRSNSWAGGDNALRFENWQLIAQAREARGDSAGAKAAVDAAERLR